LLSTTRSSGPHRPRRAITAVFLGTALALVGAGTASAVTAGSAGGQVPAVIHQATTHHSTTQPISSQQIADVTAAAPSLAHGWQNRAEPATKKVSAHPAAKRRSLNTWSAIQHAAAGTNGHLSASEELLPGATSGSQSDLAMTSSRMANATTIVHEALRKHMGLRSAVIAVATAEQESQLMNLGYGTYDSLGLFQQRPSAGWGSASEIMNPAYASDAFLNALRHYQANHPGWATQPLWEAAQGVQVSGFPYAYAKWESQAAHIVAHAARGML
jgi:hypothetical protein